MSAAVPLPALWEASLQNAAWHMEEQQRTRKERRQETAKTAAQPAGGVVFYRKHTQALLRRYLYASTQVGRAPSVLSAPIARGWASSRPVRSFEDAIIFVLDVERCIERLEWIDRQLVSRVVLQEYTQAETAALLGMCERTVRSRLAKAMDRLTEHLLEASLLIISR